jgi:NAD(P)-dependent dehydrogenase (short-subunit alcohol dehydrogenase family)
LRRFPLLRPEEERTTKEGSFGAPQQNSIPGGTDSLGFAGDVSSLKDLETFMAKVNETFGRIDTLLVNAGVTSNGPTPVTTASEDEFDRVFAINTKGAFFTVQKALPYMPKGSTIVFCTSIVDRLAIATVGVYSASKAAVRSPSDRV